MLLCGCRDRLRRQQVAGCYCGVAEVWQEVSKDPFVIVGLQSGAMTLFIPVGMQSGLFLQDCWSGTVCAAHTRAHVPYHRPGIVLRQRGTLGPPQGSGSVNPDGITQDLQRALGGPHAMPGPRCQGKRKLPRGLHSWFAIAEFQCVFFLLQICTVIKLQNKPTSKGKQVGQQRSAAKGTCNLH